MANDQTQMELAPSQPARTPTTKTRKPRTNRMAPADIRPGGIYRYAKAGQHPSGAKGQVVLVTETGATFVSGKVLDTIGPPRYHKRRVLTCQVSSFIQNYEPITGFNYMDLNLDIQKLAPIAERLGVAIAFNEAFTFPVTDDSHYGEALRQWAAPPVIQPGPAPQVEVAQISDQLLDALVGKLAGRLDRMEQAMVRLIDETSQHVHLAGKYAQLNHSITDIWRWANEVRWHTDETPIAIPVDQGKLAADVAIDLLELPENFVEPLAERVAEALVGPVVAKTVAHINRVMFTENFVKLLAEHMTAAKPVNADAAAHTRHQATRGKHHAG